MDKPFHPKANNWVGYIIDLDGTKYYIAGDTDNILEIRNVIADVAFYQLAELIPWTIKRRQILANVLNVKTVVPTHYGSCSWQKGRWREF